jgi:1,4-alpha-glucan branching enzyme
MQFDLETNCKKDMNLRNLYLLLAGVMLIGISSCKKSPSNNNTGNVTGNQNGVDPPANANDGVTFINSGKSVIFNLYAPKKTSAGVIGEFNSWQPTAMKNSKDGTRWWVQIDNLDPTKEYAYQYLIDGSLKVADPYTEKVLDPNNDQYINTTGHTVYPNLKAYPAGATGIVSTFWANQPVYSWQNTSARFCCHT